MSDFLYKSKKAKEYQYNFIYQFGNPKCHEFYVRVMSCIRAHNLLRADFFDDYANSIIEEELKCVI